MISHRIDIMNLSHKERLALSLLQCIWKTPTDVYKSCIPLLEKILNILDINEFSVEYIKDTYTVEVRYKEELIMQYDRIGPVYLGIVSRILDVQREQNIHS